MSDEYALAYQAFVKEFAEQNNLDLEVDYEWPKDVEAEFRRRFRELQLAFGRKPL